MEVEVEAVMRGEARDHEGREGGTRGTVFGGSARGT
jgi:hypothetical protein